ncbi:hypothetical protein RvY_12371-2 [Ramazzottius varieornatus]|uniref:Secreted protein n=1 Tax=Ramazzottius varieornatus TaxID=947166 RepID=A0A1D1VLA5_RAMVA|nr:hypothetical protein RvY_12371-2 [Ramazzottius varieornatus]
MIDVSPIPLSVVLLCLCLTSRRYVIRACDIANAINRSLLWIADCVGSFSGIGSERRNLQQFRCSPSWTIAGYRPGYAEVPDEGVMLTKRPRTGKGLCKGDHSTEYDRRGIVYQRNHKTTNYE